jgi:uncharacterized protein YcbX
MSIRTIEIWQYPVKGIAGRRLAETVLRPGVGVPGDRRFAIARAGGGLGPARLLNMTRHARLATLSADFDTGSQVLVLFRAGRPVARGDVTTPAGRATIEQFLAAYLEKELQGPARLMDAADAGATAVVATGTDEAAPVPGTRHQFSDPAHTTVSIINLASVRDLERATGRPIDPRRFRGNLYIEGVPAWAELDWVGETVTIGEARLKVVERTERCAATNVNPDTAARDMNLPLALKRGFGHMDMGVYATVVDGGRLVADAGPAAR